MKTWLLFDVSYLAYRAFYSTGQLHHDEVPTGMMFGVFRDIVSTMQRFNTSHFIFCFDVGQSYRCDILPTYKGNRKPKDEDLALSLNAVKDQLDAMRLELLPQIGFRNLQWTAGYEADDLIASTVHDLGKDEEAIIVSNDEDLFQLLGPRCSIWRPQQQKIVTVESFTTKYGIGPKDWVTVKAMAGCSTDNIKGIAGVGEKTAIKYITGTLKRGKIHERIVLNEDWQSNIELVQLPFKGCPTYPRHADRITTKKWRAVMKRFGLRSLVVNAPITA